MRVNDFRPHRDSLFRGGATYMRVYTVYAYTVYTHFVYLIVKDWALVCSTYNTSTLPVCVEMGGAGCERESRIWTGDGWVEEEASFHTFQVSAV